MGKEIKDLSVTEVKALLFDNIAEMEKIKRSIQFLQNILQEKLSVKKEDDTKGKSKA